MTARSLRDVYDDCNTLVMPPRPPPHPTSSVIPIPRSRDDRHGASVHPIGSDIRALRGDAPVAIPRSRADQTTQPSRRYSSEVKRYRRLSMALAICLAFVLGVTASLAAQISAHFTPVAPRTPRDGITRGESLRIFDGVEAKAAPRPRARRPVSRAPALPPPAPASTSESPSASPSEATAASSLESTAASNFESTVTPSATPDAGPSDLAKRDLLKEGLSAD